MTDHVDRILAQWARERPDLDTSAMGIIGRLHRIAAALHQELRPVFAEEGLRDGDFDILATLRRSGHPFELTPGTLGATTMVSSGTVTKRVDRLAAMGLVSRSADVRDGRVSRVALTETGVEMVDRLVEKHVANEERLLAGFSELERARLTHLLTQWTAELGV